MTLMDMSNHEDYYNSPSMISYSINKTHSFKQYSNNCPIITFSTRIKYIYNLYMHSKVLLTTVYDLSIARYNKYKFVCRYTERQTSFHAHVAAAEKMKSTYKNIFSSLNFIIKER